MSENINFEDIVLVTGPFSYVSFNQDGSQNDTEIDMVPMPPPPEADGPHPPGTEWHYLLHRFVPSEALNINYLALEKDLYINCGEDEEEDGEEA